MILRAIATLGGVVLAALAFVGRIAILAGRIVGHVFRPPFYPRELGQQLVAIGWLSLPVVGLTALFTGGALAWQI